MSNSIMPCERALAVLASDSDENSRDERARARVHASQCPRCSGAYDAGRIEAEPHEIAAATESSTPLRIALAIISAIQLVLALPWLLGHSLFPDSNVAVAHLTRDGALGLVIAALGLVTAWRPRYVYSTRILGLIVAAAQLLAGLTDQKTSPARPSFEWIHLLVLAILIGLFAVAADMSRRATPSNRPTSPILRSH